MLSGCTAADATAADMDVRLRGSQTRAMRARAGRGGRKPLRSEPPEAGGRLAAGGIFRGKFRRSDESRGAGPQESAPEGPPRVEATRQVGPRAGKVPWRERRCEAEVHRGKFALYLGVALLTFPVLGFDMKTLSGLLFFAG